MFCVIPRDTNKEQKNFLEKKANSSKISSAMWTKHKVNPQKKKGQAKKKKLHMPWLNVTWQNKGICSDPQIKSEIVERNHDWWNRMITQHVVKALTTAGHMSE